MEYYVGLDIGTNSVGWAVTDLLYNVLKFRGNAMWGVYLFDEAKQANDCRTFRSNRRRSDRRKQRITILQELFAPMINRVDKDFYLRLYESRLYKEDKSIDEVYNLFNDNNYTDMDYHKQYPTIHHLICDLMKGKKQFDVRFVYLACAYILKHRGHFLIEVDKDNISEVKDIEYVYEKLMGWFYSFEYNTPFECSAQDFGRILKCNKGIKAREKAFKDLLFGGKKPDDSEYPIDRLVMLKLISGGKGKLSALFKNENYDGIDNNEIALNTGDFDEKLSSLASELNDGDLELIVAMKGIYDWSLLSDILQGKDSISEAKIAIYETHKKDLKLLKYIISKYKHNEYNNVFRSINGKINNYTKYSGNVKSSVEYDYSGFTKERDRDNFCKYIKSIIKDIVPSEEDKESFKLLLTRVENGELCPKQVNTDNRVIPYQLYYTELKQILNNARKYIPELNKEDEYGSIVDKILSIMTFKIPYYVGPLVDNSRSKFAWLVRKAEGRILPWNFDDMVDKDKCEDEFIRRMTCQCTYLAGEDVLPKYSLLYSKFVVLNEINKIKINGEKITVSVKQEIFDNVFKKYKKVKRKHIENYLISNGYMTADDKLEGIDIQINSSLKSYHDFRKLITDGVLTEYDVEHIIERITFTTDKARLKLWLEKNYNLNKDDIKYVAGLNYKDFGRLSGKFLTEILDVDVNTGEILRPSIINMLWETNNNLMELLSGNYGYMDKINSINSEYYSNNPKTVGSMLDDMYISNAVKRPIFRTLDIVKEILHIKNEPPKKIFIEMARDKSTDNKGKRTKSRKDRIREYLNSFEDGEIGDIKRLLKELESKSDDELRGDKLYLYFMQLGRCMYSGTDIDINKLSSKSYDIDHIFPQCKVKDDSIDNRVLVLSELNGNKGDVYPIDKSIRNKMHYLWEVLHSKGMISDKKYSRLIRDRKFTDNELAEFINRQLVETRQSTKAIASILKEMMPETEIVYVKAGLASEFRHDFEMLKCREINDYHHAKDAYLNVVMGNVYNVKFTKNPYNYIKELKTKDAYSMKLTSLLKHNISRNDEVAWLGDGKTLALVKKYMNKNNIRYVRYCYSRKGEFFNQNAERASAGLARIKKDLPTEKYGGYNDTSATCFVVVKYVTEKNKGIVLMPLELMYANKFKTDAIFVTDYAKRMLNDIVSLKKGEFIKQIEFPLGRRLIKINTLIDIDGFRGNVLKKLNRGKTVGLKLGLSLIVDKESYDYIKKVFSVYNKLKSGAISKIYEETEKINSVENLKIYDLITLKLKNKIYNVMFSKIATKLDKGRKTFCNLSLDKQTEVLANVISILKSGRSMGCDLRLIGDVKSAAVITINSELTKIKNVSSIRIIDQSPTGLYEKISANLLEL